MKRSNIFNNFLTFSIQILTFPFNNLFSRFQKKMKCCRPPSFSSAIMGRSWADHGQTIGDRFMQKNPENFSFFRYRFFPKNYENVRFSHLPWTKRQVIFADPVIVSKRMARNESWSLKRSECSISCTSNWEHML